MTKQDLINHGALLEGHFELSSGLHTDTYIQCAKFQQTEEGMDLIDNALSFENLEQFKNVDVVIGGAYGAIIFANQVMRNLQLIDGCNLKMKAVFCERIPMTDLSYISIDKGGTIANAKGALGEFELRRGFEINKGDKVLIVEDVTTTGKSIGEVAELVIEHGGEVVGAVSIIDRREKAYLNLNKDKILLEGAYKSIPFISLIQLDIPVWKSEECQLCNTSCSNCLNNYENSCNEASRVACNLDHRKGFIQKKSLIKLD